jgi:protease IV
MAENPADKSQPAEAAAPRAPAPAAPAHALPPQVIVHIAPHRWQRISLWVAWTGFVVCGLLLLSQSAGLNDYFDTSHGIQERYHSGDKIAADKIAVIDVSGVIISGDGFVKHQIDRVREDDNVRAVIVRIDTPGGTVTGSDYIFHHLRKLREEKKIPLVVSMGSLATSGGYYVAMAVGDQPQAIYAEPTTTTGSIGVMIPHYDLSGLLDRLDVKDDSLATHPRKLILSMTRPMTDDHRQVLEGYLSESFERFKKVVHYGRPALRNDEGKLEHNGRDLATGEIFTAEKAKQFGLVDELGFLEEAIGRAAELAKLDPQHVRIVEFRRPATLVDSLIGIGMSAQSGQSEYWSLLERSAPRAYYLWTSLPPLLSREGS